MDLLRSLIIPKRFPAPSHQAIMLDDQAATTSELYVDALQQPPWHSDMGNGGEKLVGSASEAVQWQEHKLEVYSLEEWDKQQQLLGHICTVSSSGDTRQPSKPPLPVALPTGNTEHIARLSRLCQERGIFPQYDFSFESSNQTWTVKLTVGDTIIEPNDGPFKGKKVAKEVAAGKGCELVSQIPLPDVGRKGEGDGSAGENWVGLLLEFCHATSIPDPLYQDYQVGSLFASEVLIRTRLGHAFGGPTITFPSKKLAKANAAREAILWLRETGHIDPTITTITKKQLRTEASAAAASGGVKGGDINVKQSASYAQQVNEFYPKLGLCPPEYKFTANPAAPGFHTVYAVFPQDPLLGGRIGEVRNVFGKKAAKEECAKQVLAFLKEEADRRGAKIRTILG